MGDSQRKAAQLRHRLAKPGMLRIPGVADGFSARAAEELCFDAVYVGGGLSVGINLGLPDMGIMNPSQQIAFAAKLADLIDIPLVMDLDDAGGSPIRVRQSVIDAEKAGIAAVHIEDTDFSLGRHFPPGPGSTGHMDFSHDRVIALPDALNRIEAALHGRRNMLVIARTEARLESLDEAVSRGVAYAEAGADVVFLAHLRVEETAEAASAIPVPLMNCIVDSAGASEAECSQMETDGLRVLVEHRAVPLASYQASWDALQRFGSKTGVSAEAPETRAAMGRVIRHADWGRYAHDFGMVDSERTAHDGT